MGSMVSNPQVMNLQRGGRTIRRFSSDTVISPGTQVVLKVAKSVSEHDKPKKPGTVGVVVESPPNNRQHYLLQFTDGQTVKAYIHELAVRRQEFDIELSDVSEDLQQYVIYRCQVGSKAYGLSTEDSDDDLRGIYLPPARLDWSLYQLPEQLESMDDNKDEVYWELGKFVRLALKANPNIMETLWTPLVYHSTVIADRLRTIRQAFLSKHIYKTYSGYVLSQFRRMSNSVQKKGEYKPKHAMHLIRLLHSGISALETGEILVDVSSKRDELLHIRNGSLPFEEVRNLALGLDEHFQRVFEDTDLPEQPDFDQVNEFLIWARRSMIDD